MSTLDYGFRRYNNVENLRWILYTKEMTAMRLPKKSNKNFLAAITQWVAREYYLANRNEYIKYAKIR